jgi:hypothetical protein
VGLVLSFGLAMMMEFNDTSIRSIEDVNEYIGLEVIGTIPRMRFGRPRGGRRRRATYVSTVDEEQIDSCIVTQHDPKSPISEAYRTLRTNFQFATIKEKPHGDGNQCGAGRGQDDDGGEPGGDDGGSRHARADRGHGLAAPQCAPRAAHGAGPRPRRRVAEGWNQRASSVPTRIENLWIISSGRVPPNPSELIGSDHMAALHGPVGR